MQTRYRCTFTMFVYYIKMQKEKALMKSHGSWVNDMLNAARL